MPRPTIANLEQRIADIAQHTAAMPPESGSPLEHYRRASNDAWNLLVYFERNIKRAPVYARAADRHLARLRGMVLLSLIEAFERYIKETAGVSAEHIVPLVLDNSDRLAKLRVTPAGVAAHFSTQSLGRALCESDTWLSCESINERFRLLLADPFTRSGFDFFPRGNAANALLITTVETLWQMRHTLAHNLGMITQSDGAKLRLLVKAAVAAPSVLSPTGADVWYVKLFLDETTEWANGRVAARVAQLLTTLHIGDPTLFVPQQRADALAKLFRVQVTVAGATGNP
ncbi:hypothetical protein WME73_08950 [Sorangium sp. So ce302]|uniref:hypothetical protein n=1 Tax=Sorangium sp. So ce302 TaxID=3133297 RepID=UPI003F5EF36F